MKRLLRLRGLWPGENNNSNNSCLSRDEQEIWDRNMAPGRLQRWVQEEMMPSRRKPADTNRYT